MKKQSNLSRLMGYAGRYKYLTYASWILSAVSSLAALVPFWYIWEIIREVLAAARLANCDEFAERLPDKWDTNIGENGCELSGGERQRISIARAFLKDAPIILLDEATASLDVENETAIQTALSRLIRDKTVLVIAHRMRTVAGADKIVVLADGVVAEQGTPRELLDKGDIFKRMSDLQLQGQGWSIGQAGGTL